MTRNNLVSKYIVNECAFNAFHYYFPEISRTENGFGVCAHLPKDLYKKWISQIVGSKIFRQLIIDEIKEVILPQIYKYQTFINIHWQASGVSFETDGVNCCSIYVPSNSMENYESHNIDFSEQAHILFLCLSIFLPKLYHAMEILESGDFNEKDWPIFSEGRIIEVINLKS